MPEIATIHNDGRISRWLARILDRAGHHYILLMMIGTRAFGSMGGLLVIYYVELASTLPQAIRVHFRTSSIVVVILSCTLTVLLALWETRQLREVLKRIKSKMLVSPGQMACASREATLFVGRHHLHETWFVPCSTLAPVLAYLYFVGNADASVLITITLTVFMGISMALMSTFFAVEKGMEPVIRMLLNEGANPDYARLPQGRLQWRFGVCSTLIIMTTALMISLLARQRALEIMMADGDGMQSAVSAMMSHSIYITIAAVVTGVIYSQVLSHSVSARVQGMVEAMDRVAAGSLGERLQPTGTDEIDRLARQFNTMVSTLQHNHHTIQDLNSNLEDKVRQRTAQLEDALRRLRDTQTQMTDLARRAGMAEVATGVLHNVGNVLNTVNVSAASIGDRVRKSRSADLQRFVANLARQDDLAGFLSAPERAEKTLRYLDRLANVLADGDTHIMEEVGCLTEKIGHVKGIINTQQSHARRVTFREEVDVAKLLEEVLSMYAPRVKKHKVEVETALMPNVIAVIEKANLVQVFDNLVRNAIDAMSDQKQPRQLRISMQLIHHERVEVVVTDSGCGIGEEDLKKVFSYGFTTKNDGNGFGLHSSALAVSGVGGRIQVDSPGRGCGTTFTVAFPLEPDEDADNKKRSGSTQLNEIGCEPAFA